jgi:hypothetical protein
MTMAISESLIRYFFFFPVFLSGREKHFPFLKGGKKGKKEKKTYEYERLRDLKSLSPLIYSFFSIFIEEKRKTNDESAHMKYFSFSFH